MRMMTLTTAAVLSMSMPAPAQTPTAVVHLDCHTDSYTMDRTWWGKKDLVLHEVKQEPYDMSLAIDYDKQQVTYFTEMPFIKYHEDRDTRITAEGDSEFTNGLKMHTSITVDRHAGSAHVLMDVSSTRGCVSKIIDGCFERQVTNADYYCRQVDKPAF